MEEIDDFTVIVDTGADLVEAVSSAHVYNLIYLREDIQIPFTGATIDPNKTKLVIDGLYDNTTHTLIDADAILSTATLRIASASSMDITLRNMTIEGRNYYGVPYIYELVNTESVILTYENVTYSGPQMTHHQRGLTRYIDCDITITYPLSSRMDEIGQVNRVEIGGVTNMVHNGTGDDAAFWFYSSAETSSMKVLRDAKVTIDARNFFLYTELANPVRLELEPGSSLEMTTDHGISYHSLQRLSTLLVDTGASFRYVQEAANLSEACIPISGDLTVNEGASVYMQAAFSGARELLYFWDGGTITITNPKSFVLYDSGSAAMNFATSRNFIINGKQVNCWAVAKTLDIAGDMDDEPDDKWFRPDYRWSSFMIEGTVSGTTTVTGTDFSDDEQDQLPELSELQLQSVQVLSIGDVRVLENPVQDDETPVTGWTDPNATVRLEYMGNTVDSTSGADGRFTVYTGEIIPEGTTVTIKSNVPFLITEVMTDVITAGELEITKKPIEIVFNKHPVTMTPVMILTRINPEEPVTVVDTRQSGAEWELYASVTGPLETIQGDRIEDGVVFVGDAIEDRVILTGEPYLVYTGAPGTTDVYWEQGKGILVQVDQAIRFGIRYTTHMTWDLHIKR